MRPVQVGASIAEQIEDTVTVSLFSGVGGVEVK